MRAKKAADKAADKAAAIKARDLLTAYVLSKKRVEEAAFQVALMVADGILYKDAIVTELEILLQDNESEVRRAHSMVEGYLHGKHHATNGKVPVLIEL